MDALRAMLCCLRRPAEPDVGPRETDALLAHAEPSIPADDSIPAGPADADVDHAHLHARLSLLTAKRLRMVDVGAARPFVLSRPGSRRSSRAPRSISRQPSPTRSMSAHTRPSTAGSGLDGSLASLAQLPEPLPAPAVYVRILDRRAPLVSPVREDGPAAVGIRVEDADGSDVDSIAGDLGGPEPEPKADPVRIPRAHSESRERSLLASETNASGPFILAADAPLARSWGD